MKSIPNHPRLEGARTYFKEANGEPMILFAPCQIGKSAGSSSEDDGIWMMTLNRVKSKNGFSDEMYLVFADILNTAAKDDKVKVVILNANGDMFSSGADLRAVASGEGENLKSDLGMAHDPVGIFMRTLMRFPKMIVAAVHGPAIGVGCTMLAHCDLVYATPNASFWTPFTRIAVVPEYCSSYLFPKIMGTSTANEMLLLGKKLGAQRAKEVGFVADLFPEGPSFIEKVVSEVRSGIDYPLIGKSLVMFKEMIKRTEAVMLDEIFEYELKMLDERVNNGDTAEAAMAFFQKEQEEKAKRKKSKI